MTGHVLDACTLLNLYCGWGGVAELRHIPSTCHLPPTIASELLYVREYDAKHGVVYQTLTLSELLRQHPFELPVPTSEEIAVSVALSRTLDDGEAEGLSIASSRGLFFCSDDGAVHKVLLSAGIRASVASTKDLLLAWAGSDAYRLGELPAVVARITKLARFTPHARSPDLGWWKAQLAADAYR